MASTGSVLRLETARETTERPRARFSCITESFTSGCPQVQARGEGSLADRALAGSRRESLVDRPIFSFRHHRHIAVDTVDRDAPACGERAVGSRLGAVDREAEPGDAPGMRSWMDRGSRRRRPRRGPAGAGSPTVPSPVRGSAIHGRAGVVHRNRGFVHARLRRCVPASCSFAGRCRSAVPRPARALRWRCSRRMRSRRSKIPDPLESPVRRAPLPPESNAPGSVIRRARVRGATHPARRARSTTALACDRSWRPSGRICRPARVSDDRSGARATHDRADLPRPAPRGTHSE